MKKIVIMMFAIVLIGVPAVAEDYARVAYSDFVLDYKQYFNNQTKICVNGYLIYLGDNSYLYEKAGDLSAIALISEDMPREDRKFFMQNCKNGCNITVIGYAIDENQYWEKGIKGVSLVK